MQMGFRKNKGTIDAIKILKTAISRAGRKREKKLICLFEDLKGAFDALRREAIWEKMRKMSINERLREKIGELYE